MTRAHHVTHGRTVERLDKIRKLIAALQLRQLMREDIAELLQMGPSGVRKYIADLKGVIEIARHVDPTSRSVGEPVYRLAITADAATAYLASLATQAIARPVKEPKSELAVPGPGRHFHILADDTHYAIRVSRAIPTHDPLHALFFRTSAAEVRA